jgi:hypothetical protein
MPLVSCQDAEDPIVNEVQGEDRRIPVSLFAPLAKVLLHTSHFLLSFLFHFTLQTGVFGKFGGQK